MNIKSYAFTVLCLASSRFFICVDKILFCYILDTSALIDGISSACVLPDIWLNNNDRVRVPGLNDYASCETNCLQRPTAACVAWTFWDSLGISKKEGK